MSLIFEALRRSESERNGKPTSESSAAELIRLVENSTSNAAVKNCELTQSVENIETCSKAVQQESDRGDCSRLRSAVVGAATDNSPVSTDTDGFEQTGSALPLKESLRLVAEAPSVRPSASLDSRLVCCMEDWSLAAEKFRLLGLRLRQLSQKRPLKNVLVTSTVAGEGKSFVCANLAIIMSRKKGQRVLLIDGDLRRPVLTERFGLGQLSGLSDCLKNGISVLNSIYHIPDFNFWFLPAGNQSDNALELMQSGHLSETFQGLGGLFDWCIIDSPPLIPLADTAFLSKLADGTLLVARQGKSERRALQRGLEMIDRNSLLGVVLNATSSTDHKSYYQRYGYGAYPLQNRTAS